MLEDTVTVVGVHGRYSGAARCTVSLQGITQALHIAALAGLDHGQVKFKLMNYCEGVLTLLCEPCRGYEGSSWIIALNVMHEQPNLLNCIGPLESTNKIFVRHTASYLCYGMHCSTGTHGHQEWKIRGVSLDGQRRSETFIQLEDFVGSDIGSTVSFEIHDGYFYAVSNQTSFEAEEVDWTSFYHCVRFPIHNMSREALEVRRHIYRRQHAEGPINDSWIDLSLQADEQTNQLTIVEARREWLNGGSEQRRTFYTTPIDFTQASGSSSMATSSSSSPVLNPTPPAPLYPDDPLAGTIDSLNHPNYAPTQERKLQHAHPEYGLFTRPDGGFLSDPAPSFILSKTKLRAYNLSCCAFLDIVDDNSCCPSSPRSCLRLRVGSRRVAPLQPLPTLDAARAKGKQAVRDIAGIPQAQGTDPEDRFVHSPIIMWPLNTSSDAEKERIHRILNAHNYQRNPPVGSIEVIGVADERSLVYMARPAGSRYKRDVAPIVFVSYDPVSAEVFAQPAAEAGGSTPASLSWSRDDFLTT